jgi:hypothetical protein
MLSYSGTAAGDDRGARAGRDPALGIWRFYPGSEYIVGGKDRVYINEGIATIARASCFGAMWWWRPCRWPTAICSFRRTATRTITARASWACA